MKRIGKYAIWIGILVMIAGFVYDILYAGIPPQDPPEAIQAKYDHESRIASSIMTTGFYLAVTGGVIRLGAFLIKVLNKKNNT